MPMLFQTRTAKLKNKLRAAFGAVPSPTYLDGDMAHIRAYYDFRRDRGLDAFLIDETTWNDLDLERVFKRINPQRCTSGEQYLYYMLRSPALDQRSYAARDALIDYAQQDPERRLRAETILAKLGCSRRADLCTAFYPSEHGIGMLVLYLVLLALLPTSAVCAALGADFGLFALFVSLALNCFVHEFRKRKCQSDFDTVNYIVNMTFAVKRLRKLRDPALDALMQPAYDSLDRLRSVIRTGGLTNGSDNGKPEDFFLTVTLLDLITYEFLKNKLGRCHDDVFVIHEHLGRLDAAISIASYRAGLARYARPVLHFDPAAPRRILVKGMVHPLLEHAVPNDLDTACPILITGSNASGKSTYLKTAALAAVMAQSICTVTAGAYGAKAFRIYSSMALRDDLLRGESYYIAETKSLKRILDAARDGHPIFCVVDEILRGTNTVERIAASSEALKAMADSGVVCIAATHDVELCDLLHGIYAMYHFEEQISETDMTFDYRIRAGKAYSRNAINLLQIMGFDPLIVENAHKKANHYLAHGSWPVEGDARPR